MIMSLFRQKARIANRQIVDSVHASVVAAARHPVLFAGFGIPDKPLGRYESIGLHMILLLHRTRGNDGALGQLSSDVLDEFFKDVDHSIRELGVGDAGVPKRMKKLARMFYGRMASYWTAIDAGDAQALAQALKRNILPDDPDAAGLDAPGLAAYMMTAAADLGRQADADILAGRVVFPGPDMRGA